MHSQLLLHSLLFVQGALAKDYIEEPYIGQLDTLPEKIAFLQNKKYDITPEDRPWGDFDTQIEPTCPPQFPFCQKTKFFTRKYLVRTSKVTIMTRNKTSQVENRDSTQQSHKVTQSVANAIGTTKGWTIGFNAMVQAGGEPMGKKASAGFTASYKDETTDTTTETYTHETNQVCAPNSSCKIITTTFAAQIEGMCEEHPMLVCNEDLYDTCGEFDNWYTCGQWYWYKRDRAAMCPAKGKKDVPLKKCYIQVPLRDGKELLRHVSTQTTARNGKKQKPVTLDPKQSILNSRVLVASPPSPGNPITSSAGATHKPKPASQPGSHTQKARPDQRKTSKKDTKKHKKGRITSQTPTTATQKHNKGSTPNSRKQRPTNGWTDKINRFLNKFAQG